MEDIDMSDAWKKAVTWWLTVIACAAEAVLATLQAAKVITAAPVWWGTAISVAVVVIGIVIGKPWTWPKSGV